MDFQSPRADFLSHAPWTFSHHVLLEYILLRGVNDSPEDAARLVGIAQSMEVRGGALKSGTFTGLF